MAGPESTTTVIRTVLSDRRVRRVECAFSGFNMAEYGVWVSVLVYAYQRGGVTAAALIAAAQLLPAALVAPVASRAADRCGGASALRQGYWLQTSALAVTATMLFVGAPDALVYAAAIIAASAVTTTRPAQAALIPLLVERPRELTAINVVSGWVESVSVLAGPALAGVLIAVGGPGAAICCFSAILACSALLVSTPTLLSLAASVTADEDSAPLRHGLRAIRGDRDLAALVTILGAQYLVIGVLDVVLVVLAISVLGLGPSGAGYLNAAFGAGGVIGALAALSLIGWTRLATPLTAAALGWAALMVALGAWPTALSAFLLLVAAGATRTVLDVAGRTILLRAAPAAIRGRIFGLLEGLAMFGLALGSILVPPLMALGGAGSTLVAVGLALGAIALAPAARVRRLDRANAEPGLAAVAPVGSAPVAIAG